MTTEKLEVERKFEVPAELEVPALDGISGTSAGAVSQRRLVATYFDTEDLRLRAARITLRHRTGDLEAGWHLKLPVSAGRLELQSTAAGPPAEVPEELRSRVRSLVRHRPLVPVARLLTTRTVHPVEDGAGRALIEVVDDAVEAQHLLQDRELSWREWEAEVVAGDAALLERVSAVLLAAGARPSGSASKVGRVLDAGDISSAWWATPGALPRKGATAAETVRAHLAAQVSELLARDPQVRQDEPDAVHKMRVATRRLRSALGTFRPLLDREQTEPLRDELRWLAGVLGAARDAEVLHARLRGLLAEQPPELVLGRVVEQVDSVLLGRYREAHERAVQDLDGERCLALYEALDRLVADPPWRDVAHRPATDVLPVLVRRVDRRMAGAVRTAEGAAPGPAQDEALHEARKLAKRLRYACEAIGPVGGRRAARLAAAATELQEVLGEHQDSVGMREVLRQLGAGGSRAGHNGFTFGRLHALEQIRAEQRAEQWRAVWERASRKRLRRWMDG